MPKNILWRYFRYSLISSIIHLLVFLALFTGQLQALDPSKSINQYVRVLWTTDDGLPQNFIVSIAQTDDGYLWLGTQQGLARFNGANFKIFNHWNTPEIKAISIEYLLKGHDGSLWIATRGGGLTQLKDGSFRTFSSQDGLSSNFISSLGEDSNGRLWIGTDDKGLTIMSGESFTHVNAMDRTPISRVNDIHRDQKGNMWIATNKGIFKHTEGKYFRYSTADGLSTNSINTVYSDRSGNLWIGTEGGGLNRLYKNRFEHFTTKTGLCHDVVVSIFEDRAGNLWIGTRGGLARFQKGKFESFTTEEGFSSNAVAVILEDHEESLWVGTHNGLNQFKDASVITYGMESGLPSDFIWSILEDSKQNLWMGTHGGGLAKMRNGKVQSFSIQDGLPSGVVRSIHEDKEGSIWAGTLKGLVRLKEAKISVYTAKDGLSNEIIRSIYEDSKGTLWVGTDDGLNWFREGKFGLFNLGQEMERVVVYSIYEDNEGVLWIVTYSGIIRMKDGSCQRFSTKEGLGVDRIFSLFQDSMGNMWFGANGGGLSRYRDGKFITFTSQEGLPDNVIYQILEDRNQNLWMSSNKGVFSLGIKELEDFASDKVEALNPDIYDLADGMRTLECNGGSSPAGCFSRDGKLWFPTLKGAVMINPEKLRKNKVPPKIIIEEVIADNQRFPLNQRMDVVPGTRRIEFHYAALTFIAPEKVRYRFKLEGFEKEWIDAGSRRTAYYTGIPPGNYSFKVKACSNKDIWNEEGASFELHLKPHFYQTIFFYLLCALGVVGISLGGFRIRVKQMKEKEKHLTQLVEERTKELSNVMNQLEEANQELEKLSLTDRLTDIANRRHLEMVLEKEWRRSIREKSNISLIMVDIDFFKAYNDSYGHPQGDECLKKVAGILRGSIYRAGDLAARYGGEEFMVILSNTDSEGGSLVAERIRSGLEKLQIPHDSSEISDYVTISAGVATVIPERNSSSDTLISTTDQALYEAKKKGRNCVVSMTLPVKN